MRMVSLPRSAATGLAALVVSLAFPAAAAPAGVVPDPPALPGLSDVPGSPAVSVTPGSDGVTVKAGAGDTALQVGAGTGGVTIKRSTRGGGSGAGNVPDRTPVSAPPLRPGRNALPAARGGSSAVL